MLDEIELITRQYYEPCEAIIVLYHRNREYCEKYYDGFFRLTNQKQARQLQLQLAQQYMSIRNSDNNLIIIFKRLGDKITYTIAEIQYHILYESILELQKLI